MKLPNMWSILSKCMVNVFIPLYDTNDNKYNYDMTSLSLYIYIYI